MPRGKKSTPQRGKSPRGGRGGGGAGAGAGYSRGGSGQTSFVPFAGAGISSRGHALSLQEEARNTTGRSHWGDSDQKLRNLKVNFVSAGTYDPPNLKDALQSLSLQDPTPGDQRTEAAVQDNMDISVEDTIEVLVEEEDDTKDVAEEDEIQVIVEEGDTPLEGFIIDTTGGEQVQTRFSAPRPRSVSPTPSNSSEEVILFSGRNKQARANPKRDSKPARTVTDTIDAKIQLVEEKIHHQEHLLEETLHAKSSPKLEQRKPSSRNRGHGHKSIDHEEAIIADYIANMDDADEFWGTFNQRELGGTSDEAWQETEASSGEPKNGLNGWDRSDLLDFDDLSTSDGVVGEVQAIYSKRERATGVQYLVVMKDQTIDDARWVTAETVAFCGAMELIDAFEAEEALVAQFQSNIDESIDSDDLPDIESDEDEDQMQQKMTDEQIARLLSKQEELGMGSQKLLLFDDAADDEDEGFTGFKTVMSASKSRGKGRGPNRARGDFPAATALADAYDGFDVMDFERPSLRKKPKGRKGKIAFDLSDSELEASMQMAWDNDRQRKKEKKEEREELRAKGLLGSKYGKADLKEKYKEGMNFSQVKAEIKNFLMGDDTTLALSPMDKEDRKIVHEIANAFNLKSKSVGGAKQRFPVLYKTARTTAYISSTYELVEAKWNRRFLARRDTGGGNSKRTGGGRGGFNNAAVSYREGDIVGGSAPEIGAENKGRAMLEKMGWSSGTALGALNNKGIMTPVTHVVKNSKAGLG